MGAMEAGEMAERLRDLRSSIAWADDHVEVIDQTKLPGTTEIRHLRTVDEVVDAIARLVIRGAPALGVCGGYGLVIGLDEERPATRAAALEALDRLAARIGGARPTAVNLGYATRRVAGAARRGADPPEMRRLALEEARRIEEEDRESCRLIGQFGRRELTAARRLLTHCNTGRLAAAGWGTALGVVYAKAEAGEPVEVLASETRPLMQGGRLTAWELRDAGIPVIVVTEGSAAAAMSAHGVDAVIVGCDRVARNGDVANKIGTYGHAVVARANGIPFYVAGPMSSFDPDTGSGRDIEIELRGAEEVLALNGSDLGPAVEAWNPAFDVTPAELVTAFVTDVGVLRPPFTASIAWALEEAERQGLRRGPHPAVQAGEPA